MRTNAGADWQAAQMGGTPGNAANYIALTANATAPVATDTALAAEITTAGGGLVRAQATYAHTTGATNYTLTKTFTGNGSDAYPITINKAGVLTAAAAGTLVFETAVPNPPTLQQAGDNVTITETVSI